MQKNQEREKARFTLTIGSDFVTFFFFFFFTFSFLLFTSSSEDRPEQDDQQHEQHHRREQHDAQHEPARSLRLLCPDELADACFLV